MTTETTGQPAALLVNRQEARRRLGGIGETKLWELERDREIEAVRIGRRTFYTALSLASYVERLRAAGQSARE